MKKTVVLLGLVSAWAGPAQADFWRATTHESRWDLYYEAEAALNSGSTFSLGNTKLGRAETYYGRLSVGANFLTGQDRSYWAGVDFERLQFERPAGSPIPHTLHVAALRLGASWRLPDSWSLSLAARPGIYSDMKDIDLSDVNMPFSISLDYHVSENLTFMLGLWVDLRAEFPVLGGPGMRWRFADNWALRLNLPQQRLEFFVSEKLTLFAGAEFYRSAFRVGRAFGSNIGLPALDNKLVDYRQYRVGGGFHYAFFRGLNVGVDGGYVVDSRLHYPSANLQLTDDGGGYVRFLVNGAF